MQISLNSKVSERYTPVVLPKNNVINISFGQRAVQYFVKSRTFLDQSGKMLDLSKFPEKLAQLHDKNCVITPNLFQVAINTACNLAGVCKYCPNTKKIPNNNMPMNLFEKIMKNLRDMKYDETITFHGYNEPLYPGVPTEDYIRVAGEILPNAKKKLFTNATFLSAERLKKLFDAGVDEIMVTQHTKKGFIDKLKEIPDNLLWRVYVRYGSEEMLTTNRGGLIGSAAKDHLKEHCPSALRVFNVRTNGKVPICDDDYFLKVPIGDLNSESVIDVLKRNKPAMVNRFLGKRTHSLCKQCDRFSPDNPTFNMHQSDGLPNYAIYRKYWLLKNGNAHLNQFKSIDEELCRFILPGC